MLTMKTTWTWITLSLTFILACTSFVVQQPFGHLTYQGCGMSIDSIPTLELTTSNSFDFNFCLEMPTIISGCRFMGIVFKYSISFKSSHLGSSFRTNQQYMEKNPNLLDFWPFITQEIYEMCHLMSCHSHWTLAQNTCWWILKHCAWWNPTLFQGSSYVLLFLPSGWVCWNSDKHIPKKHFIFGHC